MRVRTKLVAVALATGLLAAACGGNDDSGSATSSSAAPGASGASSTAAPGVSTAATAPSGSISESSTTSTAEPERGGQLSVLFYSETASMDPITATGSSGTQGPRFAAVYGGLVTFLAAENAAKPWMAESLEGDAASTTWTLKLRDGITFSDGTPFDAEAVRVNWARNQDPGSRSPSYLFASLIASMAVVDPTTLVATLKAPNAHFDKELSRRGMNYIASPTAIQAGSLAQKPIGAGPFLFDSWVRDSEMKFVRNPGYFDAPRPYLDSLTFRVLPVEQQRVDTFTTGDADVMFSNIASHLDDSAKAVDGEVHAVAVPDSIILMPNNSAPPFDDARVRRVLALAVDRETLTELVSPGSSPAKSFTLADTVWDDPGNAIPDFDQAEAQRLVDEVVAERGPIKIEMITGGSNIELTEFIQAALNQLDGVDASVSTFDSPTFIGRVRAGDYQLVGWGLPWLDPDVSIGTFFESGGSSNYSKYANPKVDELIRASRASADLTKRADLYHQVFNILAEELPVVPMHHGRVGWAAVNKVHGFEMYEDGIPRWDRMWVDG